MSRCDQGIRLEWTPPKGFPGPQERVFEMTRTAKVAVIAGLILLAAASGRARGKNLLWKPVTQALLKENNRPVKTWNIYQPDKNHNLMLVQVGRNWYVFDLKQRRVYRVERSDFRTRGDSLTGPAPDHRTPVLKTRAWDSHDIGLAQEISVRLLASGDVLAIELPHPLQVY